jgi:excinuclease ABC subunit A
MYVLDEPSIGLHQRDNDRLIDTLKHLRDIGNSVLVVEHDEDMMRAADHIIDMGLGAGIHGGRVIAQGTFERSRPTPQSLTGQVPGADAADCRAQAAARPGCPTLAPKPGEERFGKSRHAPSPAAVRRAEREAHHRATQGELQALRVVGAPPATTCKRCERRLPRGPVHLRDRCVRLGQVHAGQRHAVRRRGAPALPRP